MTVLTVFLHTLLLLTLGPLIPGLIRFAACGGGWRALVAPFLQLNAALRAPGNPDRGTIAVLAGAAVAGLLVPLFSPDAVLGFVGDGFTALLLLAGLSMRWVPLPATTLLAVASGLWALGSLTGTTDLAQALTGWSGSPGTWLVFLGLALGVTPIFRPTGEAGDPTGSALDEALALWARSTLQLVWAAFGLMAFPWAGTLTGGPALAMAVALFLVKLVVLVWGAAFLQARWPRVPLPGLGLVLTIAALGLVKLGV